MLRSRILVSLIFLPQSSVTHCPVNQSEVSKDGVNQSEESIYLYSAMSQAAPSLIAGFLKIENL